MTFSQLYRQRDGKPWRSAKEKSKVLMKLFIHGLSPISNIVADMVASTCIVFYNIQLLVLCFLILNILHIVHEEPCYGS